MKRYGPILCLCLFLGNIHVASAGENKKPEVFYASVSAAEFLKSMAFQKEEEWEEFKSIYRIKHKHPFQFFNQIFNEITPASLNIEENDSINKKLREELMGLPAPAAWILLERKKPLAFCITAMFCPWPEPKDNKEALRLHMQLSNEIRNQTEENRLTDDLLGVKIAVLKWLASSASGSQDWPQKTKQLVLDRLRKKIGEQPQTAHGYYMKESMRQAFVELSGKDQVPEELKKPIWDGAEFKKWLAGLNLDRELEYYKKQKKADASKDKSSGKKPSDKNAADAPETTGEAKATNEDAKTEGKD